MGMTMRERMIWLSQIHRIHSEQKRAREQEVMEQALMLASMRNQEQD